MQVSLLYLAYVSGDNQLLTHPSVHTYPPLPVPPVHSYYLRQWQYRPITIRSPLCPLFALDPMFDPHSDLSLLRQWLETNEAVQLVHDAQSQCLARDRSAAKQRHDFF